MFRSLKVLSEFLLAHLNPVIALKFFQTSAKKSVFELQWGRTEVD